MKTKTSSITSGHQMNFKLLSAIFLSLFPMFLFGESIPSLLDDFSNEQLNSLGHTRMVIDDTSAGGKSTSTQSIANGVLVSSGQLAPARGQPAWVSLVSLLSANGEPVDISQYEGVYLNVRIKTGMLSLSVNSTDVVNFDYHTTMVSAKSKEFTTVNIPFSSLSRSWSEQTKLNTKTIASLSLVAVGLKPGAFAYEVDEIGFYE